VKGKSAFAFCRTAANLYDAYGGAYFFTLTFKDALPHAVAKGVWWNYWHDYLQRYYPFACGVRVFEIHPGGLDGLSHGLHVHGLLNMPCDLIPKYGIGRTEIKSVIDSGGVGSYLCKYLSKQDVGRAWAAFGKDRGWHCRKNDVGVESAYMEARREIDLPYVHATRCNWYQERLLQFCWYAGGRSGLDCGMRFFRLAGEPGLLGAIDKIVRWGYRSL